MRIAIKPIGEDSVCLAGDPAVAETEFLSAYDVRISGEVVTEALLRVRGASRKVVDRGNVGERVTFSTVREFSTAAEQELWTLDHVRTMPRSGTLIIEIGNGEGTQYRYLPDCVLPPPSRIPMGVSVQITYDASGGEITDTNPETP